MLTLMLTLMLVPLLLLLLLLLLILVIVRRGIRGLEGTADLTVGGRRMTLVVGVVVVPAARSIIRE